jgi:3-oxoacyl-[acyl-carrier protein] reductase
MQALSTASGVRAYNALMKLDGKAAIVTGGGTGVGRATALELARLGCDVLINYSRSADEAEATRKELAALGVKAVAVRADVSNDADCREMVGAAHEAFGRVDVLINNAGTTSFIPHNDLDAVGVDDWERIMAVNVRGPFQCVRAARGALEASGNGCVVNVSSIAGVRAIGSSIPYCASKAALNNLTVALARTLAPKVRVNAVAPGFITGRWLKGGLGDNYESAKAFYENRSPLKRVCNPEDVAAAILSFVTGSQLVTGNILPVEGGMLIAG